jgi:uncharacterized protein YjdB
MRTPPTLLRTCVLLLQLAMIAGCGITRNDYSPRQFAVQPAVSSVAVDGTVTMKATLTTNGTAQDVTAQTTWTVSNPSIATVQNNVVQGKTVGKVTVTGSYNPSSSSSASANVVTPASSLTSSNGANSTASTTVTITPAPSVITWQQPASVTAGTVLGPTQLDATANVPGTFTYNPAAGAVLQAGTQTVTATFTPNDSKDFANATATQTISVTGATPPPPTLTALQISGASTSLQTGQTIQLVATAVYSDNSTKVVTGTASWQSSNASAASVSLGTITGMAAGSTQISASYNGVSSTSTTITVSAPAPTLAAIQISGSTTVGAGASTQLTATGTYSDKSTSNLTSSVTWASSQTSVATVQGGSVNGINAGTANITVSFNGVTASTTITVTSGYVIQIDPSMNPGEIQSKINAGHAGDTVSFAAGTYNLHPNGSNPGNGAALVVPPGFTVLGPSSGAPAHFVGSGGYALIYFAGTGFTMQNIILDDGTLYLEDGSTSVTLNNNTFENEDCTYQQAFQLNAIFIAGGINNSDISYNTFQNLGQTCLSIYDQSRGTGGIQLFGLHNLTITHNTFNGVSGDGISYPISGDGGVYDDAGGHFNYNIFAGMHRIAIEMLGSNTKPSGLEVAYNTYSNATNPWALTYGLSLTAGQNMIVHDNTINANIPSCSDPSNTGCYIPYGVEIAGINSSAYNNTVEGYWGWGFAIGASAVGGISITNNHVCGPAMAADPASASSPPSGNANGFIAWEANPGVGTFTGNTASSAMTCGN